MSLRRHYRGFSMIELLVVLVICSVLYVAALGPVRAYLEAKKVTQCTENLRKLHLLMTLYANEHDGAFPKADGARTANEAFARMVPKYSSDPSVFTCPVSEKKHSYTLVTGLTRDDIAPLVVDAATYHGKAPGNVLYTDGTIRHFEPGAQRYPSQPSLPQNALVLEPSP